MIINSSLKEIFILKLYNQIYSKVFEVWKKIKYLKYCNEDFPGGLVA